MIRLICINGDSRSGRESFIRSLREDFSDAFAFYRFSVSDYIYRAIQTLFNIPDDDFIKLKMNKDTPSDYLFGYTLRRTAINLSENLKSQIGTGSLVDGMVRDIKRKIEKYPHDAYNRDIVIFVNIGYTDELRRLLELTKDFVDETTIYRLNRNSDGCFSRDNRRHIPDGMFENVIDVTHLTTYEEANGYDYGEAC